MDFQDIAWLMIMLLLSFGGGIVKRIKGMKDVVEDAEDTSTPSSHDEWEDEELEEKEFFEEEEVDEDPYFSYETEAVHQFEAPVQEDTRKAAYAAAPQASVEEDIRNEDVKVENEQPLLLDDEEFDLRKAIIYQTIMRNDYTNY